MTGPTTEQKIERAERNLRTRGLIKHLFLIDVLQDHESRPALGYAVFTLLLGTVAYHWIEGWSYLDALYFCVISLATVGYGDLTPTTPFGRAFTIVYVINGIGILLSLFDRIRVVRVSAAEERAAAGGRSVAAPVAAESQSASRADEDPPTS